MSKKQINNQVMQQIKSGDLKMKPRWYFILASVIIYISLIGIFFSVIFLTNLMIFLVARPGFANSFRYEYLMTSFPFWIPALAMLGTTSGLLLLKRFQFAYRKNSLSLALIVISAIIIASYLLNQLGLNHNLSTHTPLRRLYEKLDDSSPSQSNIPSYKRGSVKGSKHYGKLN